MYSKRSSIQGIKAAHLLLASVLVFANVSIAEAAIATYNVTGVFAEPATTVGHTTFNGTFSWDAATETVSELRGTMNSAMYPADDINPNPPQSYPLMHLNYQLAQAIEGNIVTTSVFLKDTTDVFTGGGYATTADNATYYGYLDGNTRNYNAYFTFAFDKTTMSGIADSIVYADCTEGGMMGPLCMTGHNLPEKGTMGAFPLSLTITGVAAVPLPTAVWLFGSTLAGLIGMNRKRVVKA
ncbi:MAG: VPLPA-CTERM sorting domain-containing protein [Methylomonas sp.]|jgi:hypothetical protein|uniref:hypothetical protein n=1 Tax=Methylomonas sp. TaxID=418 RepID=UPI0025E71E8B|nr:hypothetical protein [Methylomonas sp.]MCK9607317.1 VPLPA-CTERM sorting domain-containing protein [Methylomonas sp.]